MLPRRVLAFSALVTLALPGCVTHFVRESISDTKGVRIYLRSEETFRGPVVKEYDHPITIAAVRLGHILSRFDVRHRAEEGNRREGAIEANLLFVVGEGLSAALAKAGPDQAVVVMIFRRQRNLGVFDRKYLTSFLSYVRDGSLFIHLSRLDWEVSERRGLELPEPRIGDDFAKVRVQPGTAMTVIDPRSVAIDWRDPIFAHATRTKRLPTGEVLRKTILLESPAETPDDVPAAFEVPDGLTPEQLRALADLEEQRRDGAITEPQYRARKRDILEQP